MKKRIVKYYIGGEYHEATVSDVGDIEKLTTSIKTDLVSAINSIVSGGIGSEEVAKLKENLEKVQNDLGEIGTVNEQLAQEQGKLSEEQQRLSQELSESINKIVEEVSPMIKEAVDGVEMAQKELESIKEEYSGKITEINNNVTSAKNGIKEAQDKLEEHRAELETMEIGVTEAKKTIDEIKGTLTSFVKTSEFELSEAKIKENTMAIEANSKEISAKASQKELDHATGKISEFETSLKATAKELESKMSRQEVSEEIEKLNKYTPNLFKGTREWKDWNTSGNGVLITSETYKNKTIVEVSEDLGSISIVQSDLKVGDTYTVSATGSSTGANTTIVLNVGNDIEMQNSNGDTKLSPGYQRVFATFVADKEEMIISIKAKGLARGEKANITSAKLETGSKNTPWQDHVDDIFGKTVVYDTSIKQMAEEISATLKSIESIDEDVKKNTTEIKATAKGVEQVTKSVEEVGGKVTQVETDVKAVAGQVSSKISKTQLDDAIDNISLESSNQILNSDFASSFDKWSLVDKAYKLETVENRRFAFIQRSGLTADSIAALTSNAFPVSPGQEISVSFDIMIKSLDLLDNKNVAYIELFDQADKRVLRKDYSLSQLKGSVYDNKISRVGFKFKADREDVAKAKITLGLYRNGHVYFSRLNAVKGSIDSFGWTPATDDADMARAKLETRIDQKADSVEVHAVKDSIDRVSKEVTKVSTEWKAEAGKIAQNITDATRDKVTKTEMLQETNKFSQQVTEVNKKVDSLEIGVRNLLKDSSIRLENTGYRIGHYRLHGEWEVGETYTILINAEVSERQKIGIWRDYGSVALSTNLEKIGKNLYRKTFKCPAASPTDNDRNMLSFYNMPSTPTEFGAVNWAILVKGESKISDWIPAPEDMATKENFKDTSTKISKLEQDSTGFKQTVAEVSSKVDNMEIGSRNYWAESNIVGSFYINNAGAKTPWEHTNLIEHLSEIGNAKNIVVQYWNTTGKVNADPAGRVNFFDKDKKFISQTDKLSISVGYYHVYKVKIPVNAVYFNAHMPNHPVKIKIELGNIATDWTQAPEDGVTQEELKSTNTKISQIEQKANSVVTTVAELRDISDARSAMAHGKVLHEDVDFIKTNNNVVIYNNANNGAVTFVRENYKPGMTNPSGETRLKFTHTGAANPDYGGFYQYIVSRPSAVFIQRWVANLPTGRKFVPTSNPMGDGLKRTWLSKNGGAGKGTWEEYLLLIECGSSGSFGGGGHVYVNGGSIPTASAPLIWYLDSATVFDVSSSNQAQFAVMSDQISAKVEKNGVIGSINATAEKASISFDKIEMNGKVTFNHLATDSKNKINGVEATANQIKGIVGTFDNSIINTNPIFLDWNGTLPAGYANLVGSSMAKVTSGNGMGNAVRFVVPASGNVYLSPGVITNQPFYEYVTVETTFMLESGSIDGAGILFRYTKAGGAIMKDHLVGLKALIPNPVLNKWYTITKTIRQQDAAGFVGYQVYPMGGWVSFGSVTAKTVQFDSVKARPATEQEINAYESKSQITSWKKPGTTLIDGGNIYADTLKVNRLDSIAGNLGVITAGELRGKQLNVNLNIGKIEMESDYINFNGQSVHGTVTIQNGFFIGSSVKGADKTVSMITDVGLEVTSFVGASDDYVEIGRASFGSSGMYNNKIIPELNKGVIVSSVSFGDGDEVIIDSGNIVLGGRDTAQSMIHGNRWKAGNKSSHMYVNPKPGKSLMVKETDHTGAWASAEAKDFTAHGSAFFGGNNSQFTSNNGYVILRSQKNDLVYLQGKEVRATGVNAVGYVIVRGASFANGSMEEYKEDIVKMDRSGLDMIDSSEIYNYHLKSEKNKPDRKLRTGLVIGKDYKTPTEIIDGDGVDQYSMVSISWRAIQELSEKVNSLEEELVISDARLQIAEHKLGLKTNGKGE